MVEDEISVVTLGCRYWLKGSRKMKVDDFTNKPDGVRGRANYLERRNCKGSDENLYQYTK